MLLKRWEGQYQARQRLGTYGGLGGRAGESSVSKLDRANPSTDSESGAVGNPYGKIGENSTEPVRKGRFEGQVMRDLVDCQEEVLICGCTDNIGRQEISWRKDWRVPQEYCAPEL